LKKGPSCSVSRCFRHREKYVWPSKNEGYSQSDFRHRLL